MEPAGIDVVLRLYDTSELPLLNQCVFALLGQSRLDTPSGQGPGEPVLSEPVRLHIMLQRFSFAATQETRAAIREVCLLGKTLSVNLHNWEYPEPFDLRIPLLNWGLDVARGRYITCLGLNDLPLPGAFARLLTRLRATQAALALAHLAIQPVRWWGDVMLPLPGSPKAGPAGSAGSDGAGPRLFLLDRTRVPVRDLVFRGGEPDAEITDFITRLSADGAADRHCEAEPLGVRQVLA